MKHLIAGAVLALLLAACGSGGADSYYNDNPRANPPPQQITQVQPFRPVIQVATGEPTTPPQPIGQPVGAVSDAPSAVNSTVMLGDDYAANVAISLGAFCLSPFAFFLYAFAISGAIMRRYGLLPIRGNRNE